MKTRSKDWYYIKKIILIDKLKHLKMYRLARTVGNYRFSEKELDFFIDKAQKAIKEQGLTKVS